jgi:Mn2+/Fe2+ NRAMP family transporter
MKAEKIMDCERKRMDKMLNFRLPHVYLKIGIAIVATSILVMFWRAFAMDGNTEWLGALTKKGLIVGMLLISISKDREEDELTVKLRIQSYALAFVIGVIYALVMPYVDYGVSNVVKPEGETLKDLGDFQVLIFMLMIQLGFYHILKRYR